MTENKVKQYIKEKIDMLVNDFEFTLTWAEYAELHRCTTFSSVDVASRKIIKNKLEQYVS